ncbi:MAG: hypothetical protein FI729_05695 [SAR202 cluster bacterium]|nr:hypothetical protein [SAR202 cluster bacterium]
MLSLYEIQVLSVIMMFGSMVIALISLKLGSTRKDASLYPFIAATFSFFTCIPYASYIAGACFLVNTIVGVSLYRDE